MHPGRNSIVGTRFPASAARAKHYAPPVFFTECTNDAVSSPQVLCACGETAQIPSKYLLDNAPLVDTDSYEELEPIRITRQREKQSSHRQNGERRDSSAAFSPTGPADGENDSSIGDRVSSQAETFVIY